MASEISSTMYENTISKNIALYLLISLHILRRAASRTRLGSGAGTSYGLNDIAGTNILAAARHEHDPPRKK